MEWIVRNKAIVRAASCRFIAESVYWEAAKAATFREGVMTRIEEIAVPLKSLRKNGPNLVRITETISVIVYFDGPDIRVIQDSCPHMGGPLSSGSWNARTKTVRCPWHGYEYCSSTLLLRKNPNEEIWIRPLAPDEVQRYQTPLYTLHEVPFRIESNVLQIDVSKLRTPLGRT